MSELKSLTLDALHRELGGKMVPFAGYEMPVQYPAGVMKEHLHTRSQAGLFDVSHMGQVILRGSSYEEAALALEALIPVNVAGLKENRQRYGFFTNDQGGILDDLMFANRGDHIFVVVNAACKDQDIALMQNGLPDSVAVEVIEDRALLALQGPAAEAALAALNPAVADMKFMDVGIYDLNGAECWISRSGYTGEDGYEISVPNDAAEGLARALLADERVLPIGLGARDSLRLEGGMCLYGHDIDETTSPVEAALTWGIQKIRRTGGDREGGFPGAERILAELENGAPRARVGLKPQTRAPMREGVELYATDNGGEPIGKVTSGGFGPSVEGPVAMGYVATENADTGTVLYGDVRGKRMAVEVVALPFVAAQFKR
ncbi:glycine cleavage system aminomethyltransferase GcvT [Thalassovita sp.]|uniref:glycine cleavage system aminomethyltransferase GcvT n=1 Tax=Thalassovita sp. TaxID=1979401 RepID=UPI002AB07841|nr:glycine cleavage system aminomethyltransferase GcvT [Thalassovita sp.]